MNGNQGLIKAQVAVIAGAKLAVYNAIAPLTAINAGTTNAKPAATLPTILINPPNGPFINALTTSPTQFNILPAACNAGIKTGNKTSPANLSNRPLAMSNCSCNPAQLFLYSSLAV